VGRAAASQGRDEAAAHHAIFDGLVISDAETGGIVLAANPSFCRMHGYDSVVGSANALY